MKRIAGLADIASEYDAFIVDAWGVLHDGKRPFEHVRETLNCLKAEGKIVIIATNSPSRRTQAMADLNSRGIDPELYSDIVSSGEIAFQKMREMIFEQKLAGKCFFLGQEKHQHLTEGLSLERVSCVEDAGFVLNTGPAESSDSLEVYQEILVAAKINSLRMICVNPDRMVIFKGRQHLCAGAMAGHYEEMGGEVIYFGKPFSCIYEHIKMLIGSKKRVVALGDSLATDIRGGIDAHIDTILVYSGVTPKDASISFQPTYCLDQLKW